jgi:hypothetical protein
VAVAVFSLACPRLVDRAGAGAGAGAGLLKITVAAGIRIRILVQKVKVVQGLNCLSERAQGYRAIWKSIFRCSKLQAPSSIPGTVLLHGKRVHWV